MKKVVLLAITILPVLVAGQTREIYYYDSVGNQYQNSPSVISPTIQKSTLNIVKQSTTKVIIKGRKRKYILEYLTVGNSKN